LTFKRDGAVTTTDIEFDDWNSSRSSLSLSPTLQHYKMRTKAVSRKVIIMTVLILSHTKNRKLYTKCADVLITFHYTKLNECEDVSEGCVCVCMHNS
jgi:hypothetical protein